MKQRKAIIIRGSSLDRETRATKIIKTLTENNYDVQFLWWDRGLNLRRSERREAGTQFSETVFNFRAPWGPKSLILLPFWWTFIFFNLLIKEWDIVHSIQIISLPPAIFAGKIKRKPVIYDMLDTYEDTIILPKYVRNFCVEIDKLFMRLASAVILADESQIDEVNGIPNNNVITIYDSPNTVENQNFSKIKNDKFTLFYAGLLYSGKRLNLDKIVDAISEIENTKLIIAGYGDLVETIKSWSIQYPKKIDFIGEISHSEVLERSIKSDVLFVLRDPVLPVNRYICGSKILESMMCGTPMLANRGTSTANMVLKENCGLVVDANEIEEIKDAIIKLKDSTEIRKKLGANARKAYEERYCWVIMEQRLLTLYGELVRIS